MPSASTLTLLLTVAVALGLMALERLRPNRPHATDAAWLLRVALLGSVGIVLTLLMGAVIDRLGAHRGCCRETAR